MATGDYVRWKWKMRPKAGGRTEKGGRKEGEGSLRTVVLEEI